MLVEDSPTLQLKISNYIKAAGHAITVANNGETAVQLMELSGADLVICDVEMPGLDGYETVSIIREFLGEQWVPIIFITKRDRIEDFIAGFEVGADDYLVKPVVEQILHAKLKVMERFILMQQQLNEARNTPEEATKFDKLTHVYSSDHFLDLALLHWSILSRQSLPVSLLMIDIDYFKLFQEYYGEQASTGCLKRVAKAITASVHRPGDFVGRITEDDFILMLPDTGDSGAAKVAARIVAAVEALNIEHKRSRILGVVSVSIGVATSLNLKKFSLEDNIKKATVALKQANTGKGNCFEVIRLSSMPSSGI